jgi:1-acyl-sn-glycerol-3-phosphate acyltransferase
MVPRTFPKARNLNKNTEIYAITAAKLKLGEDVAIFPEGHSYTEPTIMPMLSGAARVLVEYQNLYPRDVQPVMVPVSISYSAKAKARSRVRLSTHPCS